MKFFPLFPAWRRFFLRVSSGATSIEYALIAAIVSIAIIGGLVVVSVWVPASYSRVGSAIDK